MAVMRWRSWQRTAQVSQAPAQGPCRESDGADATVTRSPAQSLVHPTPPEGALCPSGFDCVIFC